MYTNNFRHSNKHPLKRVREIELTKMGPTESPKDSVSVRILRRTREAKHTLIKVHILRASVAFNKLPQPNNQSSSLHCPTKPTVPYTTSPNHTIPPTPHKNLEYKTPLTFGTHLLFLLLLSRTEVCRQALRIGGSRRDGVRGGEEEEEGEGVGHGSSEGWHKIK